MKKRFIFVLSILMMFSMLVSVNAAEKPISVQLNGEVLKFDVAPIIQENRTLVPMRVVFEKMGAEVRWDEKNWTVWIEDEYSTIQLPVNEKTALIHRKYDVTGIPEKVTLDVPTQVYNGRAYVPLRFIGETLQATVNWHGDHRTVVILSKDYSPEPALMLDKPLQFQAVDYQEIEGSKELEAWYNTNEEDPTFSFKTINNVTYLKVSAGMKSTGGYSVKVDGLYDLGNGKVYLETTLNTPGPDDMVTQAITFPKALIKVEGNITVKEVAGQVR